MTEKNPKCPCKNTGCSRHGLCEECRAAHYAKGRKPSCER